MDQILSEKKRQKETNHTNLKSYHLTPEKKLVVKINPSVEVE